MSAYKTLFQYAYASLKGGIKRSFPLRGRCAGKYNVLHKDSWTPSWVSAPDVKSMARYSGTLIWNRI